MSKIKVIVKRPDEAGHMTNISDTLENLQRTVEGYIEMVTLASDLVVICNEEGRLRGLEPNCRIAGVDFVGTIIVAGRNGDELTDVPAACSMRFFREKMCAPYGGKEQGR